MCVVVGPEPRGPIEQSWSPFLLSSFRPCSVRWLHIHVGPVHCVFFCLLPRCHWYLPKDGQAEFICVAGYISSHSPSLSQYCNWTWRRASLIETTKPRALLYCILQFCMDGIVTVLFAWTSWLSGLGDVAPCGLRGCKNRPAHFRGQMSFKATKPGLVCVLYLSML